MNNIWLSIANARKIAAELQIKYFGLPYKGESGFALEDEILQDLWNHPLSNNEMFLKVHWDEDGYLLWLQIGVGDQIVVPE